MSLRNTSDVFTLYASELINAANDASSAFDVSRYTEVIIYIRTTAKAGSAPVVTLDVEVSGEETATHWHQHSQAVVITDPAVPVNHPAVRVTNLGKWLRLNNPAAPGTGDSVTVSAIMRGKN